MAVPTNLKQITVLCGLPFSGKTTYAMQELKNGDKLFSRDEIVDTILHDTSCMTKLRQQAAAISVPVSTMYKNREQNALNDVITHEYITRVTNAIKKSNCDQAIIDGTHLQPLSRSFIQAFPSAYKRAVICHTPLAVCVERFRKEKDKLVGIRSTITEEVMIAMDRVFVLPTTAEGFDEVEIVKS